MKNPNKSFKTPRYNRKESRDTLEFNKKRAISLDLILQWPSNKSSLFSKNIDHISAF